MARAIAWLFAAQHAEPILDFFIARIVERDAPWAAERMPLVEGRVRERLGAAEWFDGAFSAGDLMMVSVLLRLRASGLLDEQPALAAYIARGEARPADRRAFADQLAINAAR